MGQTKAQKIVKQLAGVQKQTPIATDMFLPNYSVAAAGGAIDANFNKVTTGFVVIESDAPFLTFKDTNGTGSNAQSTIIFYDQVDTVKGSFGYTIPTSPDFYISNALGDINLYAGTGFAIDVGSKNIKSLADPTSDQHAATKKYVDDEIEGRQQFVSITVEDPTASENICICRFNEAVTITKVVGVISGATSVTIDPEHGTDRTSGNDLFTVPEVISSTTTGNSETGFADATIPANSFLWLTTTALSGTPTELNLTFFYTTD